MKNIHYIIEGVLAVAIIILFVLQFAGKKESSFSPKFALSGDSAKVLPIAYVNVDSLLLNYQYSKDLNEKIVTLQENYRADVNQRTNSLQGELQDFQRKVDNNAFLTRERAEQESQRLSKKRDDLQAYADKLQQDFAQRQQQLNERLRDTIVAQLKSFNKSRGYQVIFSNNMGDNILYAQPNAYDITSEFLGVLNKNYTPKSK